jgi:hypothetical protein
MASAIQVVAAVYASNNKGEDVTTRCQQIVGGGNDDIAVNNNTFGDPDPGSKKYFTITFVVSGGQTQYKGAEEGQTLDLVP